jgi:general stress protein 26
MTRDDLLTFVRGHRWAAVSTVSPSGEPQGSVVRMVATDAFELVFDTTDTTRKTINLRHNAKVALVIGWDNDQTIQIEGLADELGGPELERLKQVYSSTYPDYCRTRQRMKGLIYFRVRPKWMRYSDFRKNPASVITVNLVTGEETRVSMPFRVDSQ